MSIEPSSHWDPCFWHLTTFQPWSFSPMAEVWKDTRLNTNPTKPPPRWVRQTPFNLRVIPVEEGSRNLTLLQTSCRHPSLNRPMAGLHVQVLAFKLRPPLHFNWPRWLTGRQVFALSIEPPSNSDALTLNHLQLHSLSPLTEQQQGINLTISQAKQHTVKVS